MTDTNLDTCAPSGIESAPIPAITLARDPDIKVRGKLMEFTDHGEVDYLDSMNIAHYCWPCLDIEAINE